MALLTIPLAGQAQTGSDRLEEEIAVLFDAWRSGLLRYLLSSGLSLQDGEEVMQEVFLTLF